MRRVLSALVLSCSLLAIPVLAQDATRVATGRYPLVQFLDGEVMANRVHYGVRAEGVIGVDPINSTAITVGYWPRGTGNQYIFASGLQVSGIIGGTQPVNPWAGDTTAAFFQDNSGLRLHGTAATSLHNAAKPEHLAQWPQAGYVPYGANGASFHETLRGRASAGDADVWWITWDGDPDRNSGRPHPLGIVAEHRVMGWNAPRGNEDILYVQVTLYNVTARDPAAYAGYQPGLREQLAALAEAFHEANEEAFAVDLPDAGYAIESLHAAFVADPDVTFAAGTNFASVNLPLSTSFAWHRDFLRPAGWTLGPDHHGPPFFAGAGLIGFSWLGTPDGSAAIHLYSNFTGGGAFPDPNSAVRAFKYHAGEVTPADGVACNFGDPRQSHICFINNATAADVRLMQSTRATRLAPGESASLVFAYVHAGPVAIPGYTAPSPVLPGDPRRLVDPAALAFGANRIDSIAGFRGYVDDNGNGAVEPGEIRATPRSLIAKVQLARAFFAHGFLAPAAPVAPEFFLIPGDNAVTVVWRPSATEATGDPYFAVASAPRDGEGINALYDPNYRQFDVEGYRIWRGRRDAPEALEVIAEFHHEGTLFRDYLGTVSSFGQEWPRCAPELDYTPDCPGRFDLPTPGVAPTRFVEHSLDRVITQVAHGDRVLLPNGELQLLAADSLTRLRSPLQTWEGVPFAFRDTTVRNGLTYFYAVTAWDVNSVQSTGVGRTSLESAPVTRRMSPRDAAINVAGNFSIRSELRGRGGVLTDSVLPTINSGTGRFNKRSPVANAISADLLAPVAELLTRPGEVALRLDSTLVLSLSGTTLTTRQHFTMRSNDGTTSRLSIDLPMSTTIGTQFVHRTLGGGFVPDPERVTAYGGSGAPALPVRIHLRSGPGLYYTTMQARGCINAATGFGPERRCSYNGPRWFSGHEETRDHPTGRNAGVFWTGQIPTAFDNAGELDGVRTIYHPQPYDMTPATWRPVFEVLGAFAGGGDYRVSWGAGGVIDSVIDLTHDVPVPFSPTLGLSWGVLNADAVPGGSTWDQRGEISYTDLACVEPLRTLALAPAAQRCTGAGVALEPVARPGPLAMSGGTDFVRERTVPAAPGLGFLLYLKGRYFLIELAHGLPVEGTNWTMRDYVGAVAGGSGVAGNFGSYTYSMPSSFSTPPLTAPGVEFAVVVEADRGLGPVAAGDLAGVHAVPDPYYRRIDAGAADLPDGVTFVNLPAEATIRVYSAAGVLVRVLKHDSATEGGSALWDLRGRTGRDVASGVYFYHVSAGAEATVIGRLTVVR
jgi:hypothetical protein